MIKHIMIIVAMRSEADFILKKMTAFQEVKDPKIKASPAHEYQIRKDDFTITMVTSGTDPKFQTARLGHCLGTLACLANMSYAPDLIINAGCAGGISTQGINIGDICIGTSTQFHDHFMGNDINNTPLAKHHVDCVDIGQLINKHNLKKGLISTGSSMANVENQMEIITSTGAIAKDMELGFIVDAIRVNPSHSPEIIPIKVIIDLADTNHCTQHDFEQNFPFQMKNLADVVNNFCKDLLGKKLDNFASIKEKKQRWGL